MCFTTGKPAEQPGRHWPYDFFGEALFEQQQVGIALKVAITQRIDNYTTCKYRLSTIPPSLGQLTSLKYLQLRANQLTTLPQGIIPFFFDSHLLLHYVMLYHHNWNPTELSTLELRELDLSSNCFSEFPCSILLTSLQSLSMTDNTIVRLPSDISMYT